MNTKKLITRLLPSRAPTCYQDPSFNRLDKTDIAMALAHTPKLSYHLISWYLLQDNSAWPSLVSLATKEVRQLAQDKNWPLKKQRKKSIKLFTYTALLDFSGIYQCQHCAGSGVVKAVQTCPLCNGQGKLKFTQTQKEKMCGIGSGNWKRDGDKFYKMILDAIDQWESQAMKIISDQLSLDKMTSSEVDFSHAAKSSEKVA